MIFAVKYYCLMQKMLTLVYGWNILIYNIFVCVKLCVFAYTGTENVIKGKQGIRPSISVSTV